MELEAIDYKPEHLLDVYPFARGDFANVSAQEALDTLEMQSQCGPTVTIVKKATQRPICIINMHMVMPGVSQLNVYSTTLLPAVIKEFEKLVRGPVDELIHINQIHKLQCLVIAEKPSWVKWATHMYGFKEEGLLRQFLPGKKDAVLMGSIIGEDYFPTPLDKIENRRYTRE